MSELGRSGDSADASLSHWLREGMAIQKDGLPQVWKTAGGGQVFDGAE
jgi:hypothetical protein